MVGIPWFFLYYFSFRFLIKKFDFKTLGREDEDEADEAELNTAAKDIKRVSLVIEGLGGRENIVDVDCCATRLRITVKDGKLVKEGMLKESGSRGLSIHGGIRH